MSVDQELRWVFDPLPPSGARTGGNTSGYVFDQDIDTFVREVLQNAHDQSGHDGDPVRVDFDLIELTGDGKDRFLTAMNWRELESHLVGVGNTSSTQGLRVRRSLASLHDKPLRIMRIKDSGTRGLTGDEDDAKANFNALCRNELVTSETENERGGSYGLGKAVLWGFSELSTVLFSSRLGDGDGRFRLFGRALLPFHETNDEPGGTKSWDGSGWFGDCAQVSNGERAISVFDEDAAAAASALEMTRSDDDSGTTITIVGFGEPNVESDRSLSDIADAIGHATAKWFWPALHEKTLDVQVRTIVDGEIKTDDLCQVADSVFPDLAHFAAAVSSGEAGAEIASPGDIAVRRVPFTVPARRETPLSEPAAPVDTHLEVKVRAVPADQQSGDLGNHIAVIRGTGMVVRYWQPSSSAIDSTFHGVLAGGLAVSDDSDHHALEQFLRACEPPEHNQWTDATPRQKEIYKPGAQGRLRQLWKDAQLQIEQAMRVAPPSGEEGPARLSKMFSINGSGSGGTGAKDVYTTEVSHHELSDGVWRLDGTIRRTGDGPWHARIALLLDAESGQGDRLGLAEFRVDPDVEVRMVDDVAIVVIEDGNEVHLEIASVQLADPLMERCRVRLDVRGAKGQA